MAVTLETLAHTAELARLDLSLLPAEEQQRLAEQMGRIFGYVDQLRALELADVPPTTHPVAVAHLFREDVAVAAPGADAMLRNAPARVGDQLTVPRVIDGGGDGG
jgi:aspartyl-tRNA(Asn)/glutamyl-tRNA(Gln) amidotransferase subunit C